MKRAGMFFGVLMLVSTVALVAQEETEQDPQVALAKEETAVVYDLGRFFGYVLTVQENESKLALDQGQLKQFYDIMTEIRNMERVEGEWAEETLEYLELDVLSVDQLIAVDELAIERLNSRESTSGESAQKGGGTGTGPIQSYIAGGAFNPIIDDSKSIGEGFFDLFNLVSRKLGK